MTSPFTITPTPPTTQRIDVGEDAVFSFTLTSLAAPETTQELVLQALLIGPDGKSSEANWLVPGPQRTLMLAGGETTTVTITARPRSTSPRGESKIKLAVADNERLQDVYVYSAPVTCEVVGKPVVEEPPRRGVPLWLVAVIVGGVVVLAGGGFAIWRLTTSRGCENGVSRPCLSGSCSGVQKCVDEAWGTCTLDDPVCATRPANDNFGFAQALTGARPSATGTTKNATRESGEPDHYTSNVPDAPSWVGDHTVWYRWTAPSSAGSNVAIDVCTAEIDSIVSVYRGEAMSNLTKVVDNNNACPQGWGSRVSFAPTAGATYYIAVGDAGGARESTFTLRFVDP